MENASKIYNLFWAELTFAISMRHYPTSKSLEPEFYQRLKHSELINDSGKNALLKSMHAFDEALSKSEADVVKARADINTVLFDPSNFNGSDFFKCDTQKVQKSNYLIVPSQNTSPYTSPSTSPVQSPNTLAEIALQYMPTLFNKINN